MLVFRQKYPKWWYDYYVMLIKFLSRIFSYLALLTDVYPSTDEEQNVHFDVPYPDAKKELSQGLPLIKWFLAIPHYIVLYFISIAGCFILFLSQWAILFIGRYPGVFFDFITWWFRWSIRVTGYAYLVTDKYPPFSGKE